MRRTDAIAASAAPRHGNAFTLIELVAVCAVIGILLAIAAPFIGRQVIDARLAAETSNLQAMGAAVRASFESVDLEGTNIAALPGSVPTGVDSTEFSESTDPALIPATTQTYDWFAKLARQMGYAPQPGVAPTPGLQPQVAQILINANRNTRLMLVGPENEPTQQRFLIASLMAPSGELAVPPLPNPANAQDPGNLALFNDIWNTNWTYPAAALPPSWIAALTPAQVQAWQGIGGTPGRLWLFCVQRIVCPKYTVTVNNTHPSDNCYVYYNLNGTTAGNSASVSANSGVSVVSGICFGRLIQAYRGSAPPPTAQLFSQFALRDNCEVTLQD
jgi:prepilin-type N-terminal cleavage/methylation domain-containing protein